MSDRRAEARRRTLLSGRLVVAPSSTLDCIVRDMSELGARLLCGTAGISDDVTLQLKAASSFKRQARIAWRRIEDCGVEFTEPESDAKAEQPHAAGHQMAPDRSDSRS